MLLKIHQGYLSSDNENTTRNVNEDEKLDAVEKHVSDNILQREGKAVSMDVLQKIYGIGMNDRRYRHKLKFRLLLSLQNVYGRYFTLL